ncbi:helix-turn-helix transcriptional regulator [Roseivirga misakiensis]|uniref:helix-turn-helix transcriptional regulator n=1 Tax=Roseivirga misakiensis TaxID=1563681 RepID=UPI00114CF412|nr:sigma factor-like helix-turn-helix DNA-binding protein [Roseivirga misakiensis]
MTVIERQLVEHLISELQGSTSSWQNQIKQRYPNLTAYDLRLCTYLKANLSTKEIATLLNITPDSVKKAKHRLRKKMNIQPWQSFDEAFNT